MVRLPEALSTGQKLEEKLAKKSGRGFHEKLEDHHRNPHESD
jgi:hypothetical protein